MKQVTRIKTFDGMIHDNQKEAERHLDRLYSDAITRIAHNLVQLHYSQIAEYVDQNLARFEELAKIKRDMIIEKEEEE